MNELKENEVGKMNEETVEPVSNGPVDLGDVRDQVVANENVMTISMVELRNAYGAQRLGKIVRDNISRELDGLGISHVPEVLPEDRSQEIRLYVRGTDAAMLIEAARTPSARHDETIRTAVGGDAHETLRRIRELVCEA